jgi:tetratricopeptide (TPR) repeat protein
MQAMNTEITVEGTRSVPGLLQKAYDKLNASDADAAHRALEEALGLDYDHAEVKYSLKCLDWWLEHIKRIDDFPDAYDRGGFILSQWKPYYGFLDRIEAHFDPCQDAVRHFVCAAALRHFQDVLGDGANEYEPDLLLQVGRCYKGTGNYEAALKYLEQAARFKREDAETIAELADVNALLSENRVAKALFREAFFLDPQKIDLRSMESELIIRLREKVQGMGYSGPELPEWIPVYGALFGVFSVKRELKPAELGRLRQSIFSLENEINGVAENRAESRMDKGGLIKPRLINRYFWLIDHYENTREDTGLIAETMLKIQIIDRSIYEWYIR